MNEDFLSVDEMRAREEAGQLVQAIREAFQNIPRPRITLHVADGLDDEWHLSDERFQQLRAMDPEEDWTELMPDRTDGFWDYFFSSDDEGWRFYLPAFMCRHLEFFPGSAPYSRVYSACVSKDHCGLLNPAQMDCVDRFVALCDEYQWLDS